MSKSPTNWALGWAWRELHNPLRYLGWWFAMFVYNLAWQEHAFWEGYFGKSIILPVLMWSTSVLVVVSCLLWLWDWLRPKSKFRSDFLREHAKPPLKDWGFDSHWLPFDRIIEIWPAPELLEPHSGDGTAGWKPDDCHLNFVGDLQAAPRFESNYEKWCDDIDSEKLKKDGDKYVLVNHPNSETDEHFVKLDLKRTKWSRVQAFLSHIREQSGGRNFLFEGVDPCWSVGSPNLPEINLQQSQMPHAVCLHAVVVTEDRRLLALQRPGPERTDYHPYTWSLSFEEQLASGDFGGSNSVTAINWLTRAVRQEVLGNAVDELFDVSKARILSVALEEEIFSPFVAAYVPVRCTSQRLAEILPSAPDRAEWCHHDFYSLDPPFDYLLAAFRSGKHTDGQALHPTSRYRIYLTLSALLPSSLDVSRLLGN